MVRSVYRTRNAVVRQLYPANPLYLIVTMLAVAIGVVYADADSWWRDGWLAHLLWDIDEAIGEVWPLAKDWSVQVRVFRLAAIASVLGFFGLMYLDRILLRMLLAYRGWLYQQPRQTSKTVMVWGALLKVLSGRRPMLYSFQGALPRMPVPSLKETVQRYLESVRPLLTDEEHAAEQQQAQEFLDGIGKKLQWMLILKSWWKSNYVTDWWERFVYHRGRDPIMINSNYYILDASVGAPCVSPVARAARLCTFMADFSRQVEHETLDPQTIRDVVPVCMNQYRRMFGTTRVPGRTGDELELSPRSKHCCVMRRGAWYRVNLFDRAGRPVRAHELEEQFNGIIADADSNPESEETALVPAFTAGSRTPWAEARETYFSEGHNKATLDVVESALFHVVFDHDEAPRNWTERGRALLHGSGKNRWFDKSITLVAFADGRLGTNAEHSWADAPVVAHMMETCVTLEMSGHCYDPETAKNIVPADAEPRDVVEPVRLTWVLPKAAVALARKSFEEARALIDDLDLVVNKMDLFGKAFMKRCKVSPDAFIQMALQLAYFTDAGRFAQTYEASMTRLYRDGRTETVRPCTVDSVAFVRAISEGTAPREEIIALFRKATATHQKGYRDAMSGKGIDRHLFALYVASKGIEAESPFLASALSKPWRLSTSQQPHFQTKNWGEVRKQIDEGTMNWVGDDGESMRPSFSDVCSPGGGFGPVADDGLGVSYMLSGDDFVYFHVSSKKSSDQTDSARFYGCIRDAFARIRALFDGEDFARIGDAATPVAAAEGGAGGGGARRRATRATSTKKKAPSRGTRRSRRLQTDD